ncbi:MAG: hypothetical protein M2R45_00921 [Verrucomicrobia subdivision 3 bacterium]|nr:hypothetical protein [Limisphaerales bacterium]MCS1414590.1 hypothetical protein [Limisphaerales bacterium]
MGGAIAWLLASESVAHALNFAPILGCRWWFVDRMVSRTPESTESRSTFLAQIAAGGPLRSLDLGWWRFSGDFEVGNSGVTGLLGFF